MSEVVESYNNFYTDYSSPRLIGLLLVHSFCNCNRRPQFWRTLIIYYRPTVGFTH